MPERIDPAVMQVLRDYDWPGNVRELENTIQRAVVLSTTGTISARHIPTVKPGRTRASEPPSLNLKQNLECTERETILRALERARGVKKDAAELMGISQRAMSYYLAKHRMD